MPRYMFASVRRCPLFIRMHITHCTCVLMMLHGRWEKMPSRELVPGDLIELTIGDIVPADAILLEGQPLQVDQSALTGESLPVTIYPQGKAKMGSAVKRGEAHAVVCGTGRYTFFGKAAELLNQVVVQGRFQKIVIKITLWLLGFSILLVIIIFVRDCCCLSA